MPECDYCEASFDDEEAYLDHLADAHEGDLGRVDRRRVEQRDADADGDGRAVGPAVLGVLLLLAGGVVVYVTFLMGGTAGDGTAKAREIPDDPLLSAAESFPSNGRSHVRSGTSIEYERVPPLSGPHYPRAMPPGFYERTPPLGRLVHSLEHGYVVIYYDPAELTPAARDHLTDLTRRYTGTWSGVIVAPHPEADPQAAYVLTAWQVRLRLDEYDRERVRAFLDAFRGRGPEHPVR